jgi:hypothetical protein
MRMGRAVISAVRFVSGTAGLVTSKAPSRYSNGFRKGKTEFGKYVNLNEGQCTIMCKM